MAPDASKAHSECVHNGPSAQTGRSACCGSEPQVLALTGAVAADGQVELVRCRDCGRSTWLVGGAVVDQNRALAALSAAVGSPAPRPAPPAVRRPRTTPAEPAADPGEDLAGLLAGWKVLGASD